MHHLKQFLLSAACIGVANILIEWFFIGFLFHKQQALTPNTWRKESSKSYAWSTFISFVFGALFTLFYFKIGTRYVIYGNVFSAGKFGLLCFGCFAFLPQIIGAIYVNYDKKFVAGAILAALVSYLAAATIACLFYLS